MIHEHQQEQQLQPETIQQEERLPEVDSQQQQAQQSYLRSLREEEGQIQQASASPPQESSKEGGFWGGVGGWFQRGGEWASEAGEKISEGWRSGTQRVGVAWDAGVERAGQLLEDGKEKGAFLLDAGVEKLDQLSEWGMEKLDQAGELIDSGREIAGDAWELLKSSDASWEDGVISANTDAHKLMELLPEETRERLIFDQEGELPNTLSLEIDTHRSMITARADQLSLSAINFGDLQAGPTTLQSVVIVLSNPEGGTPLLDETTDNLQLNIDIGRVEAHQAQFSGGPEGPFQVQRFLLQGLQIQGNNPGGGLPLLDSSPDQLQGEFQVGAVLLSGVSGPAVAEEISLKNLKGGGEQAQERLWAEMGQAQVQGLDSEQVDLNSGQLKGLRAELQGGTRPSLRAHMKGAQVDGLHLDPALLEEETQEQQGQGGEQPLDLHLGVDQLEAQDFQLGEEVHLSRFNAQALALDKQGEQTEASADQLALDGFRAGGLVVDGGLLSGLRASSNAEGEQLSLDRAALERLETGEFRGQGLNASGISSALQLDEERISGDLKVAEFSGEQMHTDDAQLKQALLKQTELSFGVEGERVDLQGEAASISAQEINYGQELGISYQVKAGDTLWKIAQTQLGDGSRWPEIAALSGLQDPGQIQVGQQLQLSQSEQEHIEVGNAEMRRISLGFHRQGEQQSVELSTQQTRFEQLRSGLTQANSLELAQLSLQIDQDKEEERVQASLTGLELEGLERDGQGADQLSAQQLQAELKRGEALTEASLELKRLELEGAHGDLGRLTRLEAQLLKVEATQGAEGLKAQGSLEGLQGQGFSGEEMSAESFDAQGAEFDLEGDLLASSLEGAQARKLQYEELRLAQLSLERLESRAILGDERNVVGKLGGLKAQGLHSPDFQIGAVEAERLNAQLLGDRAEAKAAQLSAQDLQGQGAQVQSLEGQGLQMIRQGAKEQLKLQALQGEQISFSSSLGGSQEAAEGGPAKALTSDLQGQEADQTPAWIRQIAPRIQELDFQGQIPMKAGDYQWVDVEQDTQAQGALQVREGQIVPEASQVEFSKALDAPLWIEGEGAYLERRGEERADLKVELGGMLDIGANSAVKEQLGYQGKGIPLSLSALGESYASKLERGSTTEESVDQERTQERAEKLSLGEAFQLDKHQADARLKLSPGEIRVGEQGFNLKDGGKESNEIEMRARGGEGIVLRMVNLLMGSLNLQVGDKSLRGESGQVQDAQIKLDNSGAISKLEGKIGSIHATKLSLD